MESWPVHACTSGTLALINVIGGDGMLMLDTVKRAALLQKEAIWVDADGDEVLAGLTLSESHFFWLTKSTRLRRTRYPRRPCTCS